MNYNKYKYNRLEVAQMHKSRLQELNSINPDEEDIWTQTWIIDDHGNLILAEETEDKKNI